MQIIAALALTILPGSWIIYGLRLTGISSLAKLAMAVALSPSIVGLQLAILETLGVPFAVSANVLVLINLPCVILQVRRVRSEQDAGVTGSWRSFVPLIALLIGIPMISWFLIPGSRAYAWSATIHTDIVYTIARDGLFVEETNLAGLSLAYGWIGHSYWSLIGWIGDWAPTMIYPFTNVWWIMVTFILSYDLGRSGLGLHPTAALLGVALMFLGTNVVGMVVLIVTGYGDWWQRYGEIRFSPLLSKFYTFDTMLWGMALLIAMALVYTVALRRKVVSLDGLTIALLVALGLAYPVLFPAGLVIAGCFLFLIIVRLPKDLPTYTRWEIARLGFAVLIGVIAVSLYLELVTADRTVATFARTRSPEIVPKSVSFLAAIGPFIAMAALPFTGFLRRRHGPALLLGLSALALSPVYILIDLSQLEYKYVLAVTIPLAFLAAAAMDPLFWQRPRLGSAIGTLVVIGLAVINLLMVFQVRAYIPGNLDRGAPLDEGSFWIALSPSEPDSVWTDAIREFSPENTVVIARKPGIQLSAVVGRSMYVPSDLAGGDIPGYNLKQRFYLVNQRGYPEELYNRRLEVVETLYTSAEEAEIIKALHDLKEIQRPVAIYFPSPDLYLLRWLEAQALGRVLVSDGQNTVWLVDDPGALP